MRLSRLALFGAAAVLVTVLPASAGSAEENPTSPPAQAAVPAIPSAMAAGRDDLGEGWTPVGYGPWDQAAGVTCDFAIHAEPVVDEVMVKTLETYPDGSVKRLAVTGALVLKVTNTETGASTKANASGEGFVEYAEDGTMTWYSKGPVLLGFREDAGTLPRGLWIVDGLYIVEFNAELDKNIRMGYGRTHDVCTDLD